MLQTRFTAVVLAAVGLTFIGSSHAKSENVALGVPIACEGGPQLSSFHWVLPWEIQFLLSEANNDPNVIAINSQHILQQGTSQDVDGNITLSAVNENFGISLWVDRKEAAVSIDWVSSFGTTYYNESPLIAVNAAFEVRNAKKTCEMLQEGAVITFFQRPETSFEIDLVVADTASILVSPAALEALYNAIYERHGSGIDHFFSTSFPWSNNWLAYREKVLSGEVPTYKDNPIDFRLCPSCDFSETNLAATAILLFMQRNTQHFVSSSETANFWHLFLPSLSGINETDSGRTEYQPMTARVEWHPHGGFSPWALVFSDQETVFGFLLRDGELSFHFPYR